MSATKIFNIQPSFLSDPEFKKLKLSSAQVASLDEYLSYFDIDWSRSSSRSIVATMRHAIRMAQRAAAIKKIEELGWEEGAWMDSSPSARARAGRH